MNGLDDEAYRKYFGTTDRGVNPDTNSPSEDSNGEYTYNQFVPKQDVTVNTTADIPETDRLRYIAENNIDDIDQLGEMLRKILNAAWGSGWGEISPDLKKGESSDDIRLPQITYDTNNREVAEKMPIKPVLTDTISEVVNGEKTGDAFNIYRQWFDSIVEFNFWGRNNLEARTLMSNFEAIMGAYAGYLKRHGVSEIFFLKEVSSRQSIKFVEGVPMRCLMYYVRLERVQSVRLSTIQKIEIELGTIEDIVNPDTLRAPGTSPDNINTTKDGITYNL